MSLDLVIFFVSLLGLVAIFIGLYWFYINDPDRKRQQAAAAKKTATAAAATATSASASGVAPTQTTAQRRARGALDRMQKMAEEEEEKKEEHEEGDEPTALTKEARRKIEKDQKKAEKKDLKKAEAAAREEKTQKLSAKEEARKQKEAEKEAEWARKEEEERKKKEEEEKKAEEEYNQWKVMFTKEAEGSADSESQEEKEGLLQKFITYIKTRKVVMLEDVAAEFKLRTQDVINRLKDLEESGRITGVTDDRGKFIFITFEELKSVAQMMRKKGRISKADLVLECNRIIRLNPTAEDKAKIMEEERKVLEEVAAQDDSSAPSS